MHEVLVEKCSNGEICYWSTFKWIYACRVTWYAPACVCIKLMESCCFLCSIYSNAFFYFSEKERTVFYFKYKTHLTSVNSSHFK